ncbi:MAG: FAD-dependent oxidoreductase [Chloroflexi bacterium]|nr:FAD-dependent oxidoreductase [Chloroflexota bacterium]
MDDQKYFVAVVGAGPAGLFAARNLAQAGAKVVLFNRDIKPGGLAEYGIYYTKYRMKKGLRKQFCKIINDPNITYYGNLTVGEKGDLSLDDLRNLGFQAIMVTVGAQGTKWLGLPGEGLLGVYHAKDLVYHYNQLPPFSKREYPIGKRVALIGVGNVMMDIAHWVVRNRKVQEAIAVARRGPAEVKFTTKELENVSDNIDMSALDVEIERVTERMLAVDQSPDEAREFLRSGIPKAKEAVSETEFRFEFLSSPEKIIGDEQGKVIGLKVADTHLIMKDGVTKARPTGETRVLDVDTVVFCIGDKVDDDFGLPIEWNEYVKAPQPKYPINDISYEVYDPEKEGIIEDVFVAGWSREASSGLVGLARKDGENGARAMTQYLQEKEPRNDWQACLDAVAQRLSLLTHRVVLKGDVDCLHEAEILEAEKLGLEDFKYETNEEMLAVID